MFFKHFIEYYSNQMRIWLWNFQKEIKFNSFYFSYLTNNHHSRVKILCANYSPHLILNLLLEFLTYIAINIVLRPGNKAYKTDKI